MKCSYAQAATDEGGKRKRPPVSCKLYDARSKRIKKMGRKPEIVLNMWNELAKSLKPRPFSYLLSDQEASSLINTVIGNVPLGSYPGYQLFDKKKSQTVQESIPFLTYHWLIWTTHLSLQFLINLRMMSLNCPSISGARMVVSKKQETNNIQFWQSCKKKKTSHWIFCERHICSKGFIEGIIHSSWKITRTYCEISVQQKNAENVQAVHCFWCWACGEPLFPLPWCFPKLLPSYG